MSRQRKRPAFTKKTGRNREDASWNSLCNPTPGIGISNNPFVVTHVRGGETRVRKHALPVFAWQHIDRLRNDPEVTSITVQEPGRRPFTVQGGQVEVWKLRSQLAGFAGGPYADRTNAESLLSSYRQRMETVGRRENIGLLDCHPAIAMTIAKDLIGSSQ